MKKFRIREKTPLKVKIPEDGWDEGSVESFSLPPNKEKIPKDQIPKNIIEPSSYGSKYGEKTDFRDSLPPKKILKEKITEKSPTDHGKISDIDNENKKVNKSIEKHILKDEKSKKDQFSKNIEKSLKQKEKRKSIPPPNKIPKISDKKNPTDKGVEKKKHNNDKKNQTLPKNNIMTKEPGKIKIRQKEPPKFIVNPPKTKILDKKPK
ncbi:MAG: hypothetical protein ACFFD1_04875 [Candidatus Thorarchaeota archaeon]